MYTIQFGAAWEVEKRRISRKCSHKVSENSTVFPFQPLSLSLFQQIADNWPESQFIFLRAGFWSAAVIVCLYSLYRYMWLAFMLRASLCEALFRLSFSRNINKRNHCTAVCVWFAFQPQIASHIESDNFNVCIDAHSRVAYCAEKKKLTEKTHT